MEEKEIHGYKAFNKDLTNRYGTQFEVGKTYTADGNISFGNHGNGFHLCLRLEDTLRYFPAKEEEIAIAEVTASGEIAESWDDYYGYYDMYAARTIKIDRILTREEIINMFLIQDTWFNKDRVERFIQLFKLTKEEIEMFKLNYTEHDSIILVIEHYQEGNETAYSDYYEGKRAYTKK